MDAAATTTSTVLAPDRYLDSIRADGARMSELAGRALDAEVVGCPGWTVRDALLHTGEVYSHKVAAMRGGRPRSVDDWQHASDAGDDPVGWYQARLDELLAELEQRGPDASSWTWYEPTQTVGFWYRRMAQESAVHRVDVESGLDMVRPIDHDIAVDGIDELLDWFLVYQGDDPEASAGGTVAVRTGDHIWRVRLAPTVELSREPGAADAVVSGEPSELLLWLWGRRPDRAVTVEGDPSALTALRSRLHDVTQ
jgi:uncharacterized protein (TIGR03083 family)